jgi:glycosyltransferase involved in cell wall biosynthesis
VQKLVIQIPCFNEEATLPITLADLPRNIDGFDRVEWLVVDDGSTDRTASIARSLGVDHVIELPSHRGLAQAFMAAIRGSLAAGADVIVTTDADNQYVAADIPKLLAPILAGTAGMVVGARPIESISHFSATKKVLERVGSAVVRVASGTDVTDAPCGFRAFSREAAQRLEVRTRYTYTLETILRAHRLGIAVASVPVRTNPPLRASRLVRNSASYVAHSAWTLLRVR